MKKIGLFSDVHGNYHALIAILSLFKERGCCELIHTGDVINIGPKSRECLDLLLSQPNITLLLGNHDRDFILNEYQQKAFSHVPEEYKSFVFNTLTEGHRKQMAQFPLVVKRVLGGRNVAFTHYAFNPQADPLKTYPFRKFVHPVSVEQFNGIFADLDCDVVFFGHEHSPCDLQGDKLYVDVGSVGCHPEPIASGIIISYDDNNFSYERVSAPYDMQKTFAEQQQVPCGNALYDYYFLRIKR